MKILFATFKNPKDFLARLDIDGGGGAGTLRVATKAKYDPDEEIILEIGFPGLPNRILTRAVHAGPGGSADEILCRFADGEDDKRDFLVAVAAGRATASWKRRHRRFPMRLPARFVVEGEESDDVPLRGDAEVEDMGSGGVSLKTSRSLPDGARVTIVLDPLDGSAEIEFAGRVVWRRNDDAVSGVGIQFDSLGGDDMKRLRRMIRDVKLRGETTE
jgi:Tfp pilus assembly protein PilZ